MEDSDITALLAQWRAGGPSDELFKVVFENLRRIAASQFKSERADHTLQPTAIVNEAWMKLISHASGNTYTQKVHFSPNGTWQDFSESDIYVSNSIGTAEATNNRAAGGQWAVRNGQLWLSSQDSPQLQPVPLSITRNSNGSPIITADGREYSMCN